MLSASANVPRFVLPEFEGPLDLLLHLIRENRVEIYDIPIFEITRQYLAYLSEWEALDLTVAGEYLVMAATLVQIKSQMLLPQPQTPGEAEPQDPRAELVERLLEYQKYQGAVDHLRERAEERALLFFRAALENPEDYALPIPEGVMDAARLAAALRRVLESAEVAEAAVSAVVPRRRVSLKLKMAELLRKARRHPEGILFEELFEQPLTRTDIVLTFLALLELIRLERLRAHQKRPHDSIVVFPAEALAG